MICGKNSFPDPLSPVTNTDKSIGATRTARCTAAINAAALPTMPKRCLARNTSADGAASRIGASGRIVYEEFIAISFCFFKDVF
jgi:hypothetical protein